MNEEIAGQVRELLAKYLGIQPDQMRDGDHLMNDLGADSLAVVEIQMLLEEEFGIEIPDEDADQLQMVGAVIRYVEEKAARV